MSSLVTARSEKARMLEQPPLAFSLSFSFSLYSPFSIRPSLPPQHSSIFLFSPLFYLLNSALLLHLRFPINNQARSTLWRALQKQFTCGITLVSPPACLGPSLLPSFHSLFSPLFHSSTPVKRSKTHGEVASTMQRRGVAIRTTSASVTRQSGMLLDIDYCCRCRRPFQQDCLFLSPVSIDASALLLSR